VAVQIGRLFLRVLIEHQTALPRRPPGNHAIGLGEDVLWEQRGTIVIAVFEGLPRLFNPQTGESLYFPQTIDPGPVGAFAVGA